tara:strand:+ start:156 stop:500 length:345 start_codon:yes stop_codon:yes gene_type:complete
MKQGLQTKVNELELTLNSLELNAKVVRDDLKEANKRLEDASKPIITKSLLLAIQYVIDESLRNSSLSEVDSYAVDFKIDHNNSLVLDNIEFNDSDQLSEEISDGIELLFTVIED